MVKGGNIRNSVIRHEVMIEPDVDIEDCIIMDYCFIGKGSRLRRAIIGRYNLHRTSHGDRLSPASDRQLYPISPSGI